MRNNFEAGIRISVGFVLRICIEAADLGRQLRNLVHIHRSNTTKRFQTLLIANLINVYFGKFFKNVGNSTEIYKYREVSLPKSIGGIMRVAQKNPFISLAPLNFPEDYG